MVSFYEGFNLACQLYAIPACIIYIVFLYILFKKRRQAYNSVFYDYIRVLGIVDLTVYFTFYGVFRAGHFSVFYPVYEEFLQINYFTTIWLYLTCIFQHAQHYLQLCIAINRFSIFYLPHKFHRFMKLQFKITFILIFIAPAAYMSWILFARSQVRKYSVPGGFPVWYAIDNLKPWDYTPSKGKIFAIIGLVCYLLSFFLNCCTVLKLRYLRKKGFQKQSADIKLFFISQLLFFTNVIHCVFYVFLTFHNGSTAEVVYYFFTPFQCITYDLATLSTPICFMAMSPSLRKNILNVVLLKHDAVSSTTTSGWTTKSWT